MFLLLSTTFTSSSILRQSANMNTMHSMYIYVLKGVGLMHVLFNESLPQFVCKNKFIPANQLVGAREESSQVRGNGRVPRTVSVPI